MSSFASDEDKPFYLKTYSDGFFDNCGAHGFLPVRDPLARVPEPYLPLQDIVDRIPAMVTDIRNDVSDLENCVIALPNFVQEASSETDVFVIQALYRAYTCVASAYCLEPVNREFHLHQKYGRARSVLPANIAQPLSTVAAKLGASPWLDYYYAYSIGNYIKKDPSGGLDWRNLDMAVKFCGSEDEIGFSMMHTYISELSPDLLDCIFKTAGGVDVKVSLKRAGDVIQGINTRRKEMWTASQPSRFNDFRIFLMGISGNEELFGPGVVFDTCYDQAPQQFRGASGAQDSIVPMLDIFTGIVDYYPTNELTKYLMDLRTYRPKCTQQFLIDLRTFFVERPLFRTLAESGQWEALVYLLRVIDEIYLFRNGHWQMVQKYIMNYTKHDRGTGGTPVTTWLMNQISSVLQFYRDILDLLAPHAAALSDPEVVIVYHSLERSYERKARLLADQTELLRGGLDKLDLERMHRSNSESADNECPVGGVTAAAAAAAASVCPHPRSSSV